MQDGITPLLMAKMNGHDDTASRCSKSMVPNKKEFTNTMLGTQLRVGAAAFTLTYDQKPEEFELT